MSDERRAPYLHIMGREGGVVEGRLPEGPEGVRRTPLHTGGEGESGEREDREASAKGAEGKDGSAADGGAESGLAQALMYACVSWVALVREEAVQSVDLTPIGQLTYEADVLLESGERLLLRVGLVVEPGLVVRTVVEPARPA